MKILEPSLLSINKEKVEQQLSMIKEFGLKYVHYDVMDGKFVPPTAFTNEYLKDLELLDIKPNIHMMVLQPAEWIEKYKTNKVNSITFHVETQTVAEAKVLIDKIHSFGFKAGVAVKPNTDLNQYLELLNYADIVLIMAVEPGWGGQSFANDCLTNLEIANAYKATKPDLIIEIDGGINFEYIKQLYNSVDWFVSGSWFFKNIDHMSQFISELKLK